ncbi:hypothetical protein GCM10023321_37690 [Pseudonocardia eucalypti]|uniref:DUF4169 family protein n=1 Tax=Pseudonocardia eucalypti TaxID=648755 RepID=A0ABP9QBA4_9PSEU|nr:hypothetical protein [Pseudonocardia eucalypti]
MGQRERNLKAKAQRLAIKAEKLRERELRQTGPAVVEGDLPDDRAS